MIRSYRYGDPAEADDPWGYANSLEWATSCPSPRHNFTDLPRIRSERPAFDLHLHYPHMVERTQDEKYVSRLAHGPTPSESLTHRLKSPEEKAIQDPGDR